MKNYINYHIDLLKVPNDVKKTFYLDDFLVKDNIIVKDNNEKLITIKKYDKNLKISPFWEDNIDVSNIFDEDLKYVIELEGIELKKYVDKNLNFGIKIRETVYKKLIEVNKYLKGKGFELSIKIGYRPIELQKIMFKKMYDFFKLKFANLNEEELYKIVCEYISDADNFTPPHSTGGAVDLVLVDVNGSEVDMGYPINFPGEESNITYDLIGDIQKKNRLFLCDTMLNFGFANLSSEWWHFSYGDPIWAYFYGKKESLYGSIL